MNEIANEIALKVKRLHPQARLPGRAHNSAGYDLYASEDVEIPPGAIRLVPTGIAAEFPPGYAALVWDRSGMAVKGIHRLAGVVDSDYRGEWKAVLVNLTAEPYVVRAGDRIAQVVIQRVEAWPVEEVSELSDTSRGEGGYGSTGR